MPARFAHLGVGLLRPVRRQARGFVLAQGEALVRSCIGQVVGTRRGELPWRPRFGSNVEQFRHQNMRDSDLLLVGETLREAVRRYEPRADVVEATAQRESPSADRMIVRLTWAVHDQNDPRSTVLIGPVTQEVSI